jgi:hypothetical protein
MVSVWYVDGMVSTHMSPVHYMVIPDIRVWWPALSSTQLDSQAPQHQDLEKGWDKD